MCVWWGGNALDLRMTRGFEIPSRKAEVKRLKQKDPGEEAIFKESKGHHREGNQRLSGPTWSGL